MKIIKPSFTEMYNSNPQKHIEEIARTCYKSNNLITADSHKKFIKLLYDNKHWAMLEHFIFIYKIDYDESSISDSLFIDVLNRSKYIKTSVTYLNKFAKGRDERFIVSFNARSLLDLLTDSNASAAKDNIIKLIEQIVYDYNCDELFGNKFKKVNRNNKFIKIEDISKLTLAEQKIHGWKSIKFICDRGISHEIVRHRDASYAMESLRYCNYSKDKFGNEITVIKPFYLDDILDNKCGESITWTIWKNAISRTEEAYFELLEENCTPQEARAVLPNSIKTELIMTARFDEWIHFFELRCDKTAHPQMRELTLPLFDYFCQNNSRIFNMFDIKFN